MHYWIACSGLMQVWHPTAAAQGKAGFFVIKQCLSALAMQVRLDRLGNPIVEVRLDRLGNPIPEVKLDRLGNPVVEVRLDRLGNPVQPISRLPQAPPAVAQSASPSTSTEPKKKKERFWSRKKSDKAATGPQSLRATISDVTSAAAPAEAAEMLVR